MRGELGDEYVVTLRALYQGRVPGGADLVTYWFERARQAIETGKTKRAGLLATQGIRGGANRTALERILDSGGIFMAWSDREWILDGANVRVSIVGFDDGSQAERLLDNLPVQKINANLTSEADTTLAVPLPENARICFIGASPHGRFDIDNSTANKMLSLPLNVNVRPNSDVVRPVASGADLVRVSRNAWTIDFGTDMTEEQAAQYEAPFEHVKATVYPMRKNNHRDCYRLKWWLYAEPQSGMRKGIEPLSRFIATPRVSKHRVFVWQLPAVLCNDATVVITRGDDYFFGVLHSRLHEVWALTMGTALEDRPRYTPTSTFETFPFPWTPGKESQDDPLVLAIAQAASELVTKRDAWLNPPDAKPETLSKRTLTNLYNERPSWLADLHRKLDEAVFAAYGWPSSLTDAEVLERLLALNHQRAAIQENGGG
jgi:type II restriction/modification system DNA methylase subunit YeeA